MNLPMYNADEYDKLIKPVMFVSRVVSFWPLDRDCSRAERIFRVFHLFILFFMVVVIAIATTAEAIHNLNDLDEATECALLTTAFYLCAVRLTVYGIHQKDMLFVVETMRSDWIQSTYEDKAVLKEKCLFAFRLAKYFISTVAVTIVLFMTVPILEMYVLEMEERHLPFRGYFGFNYTVSPIFECFYLFNVTAGAFGGSMIAGATSFNLVVIMHGSAKFAVLRKRLEGLRSDDPHIGEAVADCIQRHQDAITFADALEKIINVLALGQFVLSTGLVCFAGFQITSMMEDKTRLMKYCTFLNSAILELFMFSFSGNQLIDESATVSESAYSSDWIGSGFTQDLQIMIMRSRVPSQITAAKFYSMSLESFAAVLSTSFSYLTVLTTVNDEEE